MKFIDLFAGIGGSQNVQSQTSRLPEIESESEGLQIGDLPTPVQGRKEVPRDR